MSPRIAWALIAFIFAVMIGTFLTACPSTPPAPPVVVVPDAAATCSDVCRHMRDLHCQSGLATPGGIPCESVCLNIVDSPLLWDLECRARASSCVSADACEAR